MLFIIQKKQLKAQQLVQISGRWPKESDNEYVMVKWNDDEKV
jgi:hypothetical protein